MDIWETDKLILFIAFVIPGFISIKAYELLFPTQQKESSKLLVDAIAYSCVNYALLYWPISEAYSANLSTVHPFLHYLGVVITLFIAPIFWVYLWKRIRESSRFQKNAPHPVPKAWDYVFSQRKRYWVKVTLKDGSLIGGRFAEKSFASSAPADEQLYLEETWILNEKGGFVRPKNRSNGLLILNHRISHVELIEYMEEDKSDN